MDNMPPVSRCDVQNCFYNRELQCHAPAINVGGSHPNCDTFIPQGTHIGLQTTASVGACHVSQCKFNADLTCNADGIVVSHHAEHADCGTYTPR